MAVAFAIGLADAAVLQTPVAGQALPFQETAVRFYFQFVLFPPAMGVVFLAGLLAPRAQWLVGAIVGTMGAVLFYVLGIVHTTTPIDPAAIAVPILAAITFSAWFGASAPVLEGDWRDASVAPGATLSWRTLGADALGDPPRRTVRAGQLYRDP